MPGNYDSVLVLASCLVAVIASFGALELSRRITIFAGRQRLVWLVLGACVMGTGIWSMHFVGMRAFRLPVSISFDLGLTVLSWVCAVLGSLLALAVSTRATRLTGPRLMLASLVLGAAICLMHYIGMAAMRMTPGIHYDPALFAASLLIAVLSSAAALYLCFSLRFLAPRHVTAASCAAALVMGAAIAGMHYTGMAAARYELGARCAPDNGLAGDWMGLPVAAATAVFVIGMLGLILLDARRMLDHERRQLRVAAEERVRWLAFHDAATGLPNRDLFTERLLKEFIAQAGTANGAFGMVYMKLCNWRALQQLDDGVRDTRLRAAVETIQSRVDTGDVLVRLSPDGFALLLVDGSEAGVQKCCLKLISALSASPATPAMDWAFGTALYPRDGVSARALIGTAMQLRPQPAGSPAATS